MPSPTIQVEKWLIYQLPAWNIGWNLFNFPLLQLNFPLLSCHVQQYKLKSDEFCHVPAQNIGWTLLNLTLQQLKFTLLLYVKSKITGWIWMNYDTYSLKYWLYPAQFSSMKLKLTPLSVQVAEKKLKLSWILATTAENISLILFNFLPYSSNFLLSHAKSCKLGFHLPSQISQTRFKMPKRELVITFVISVKFS